MDNTLTQLMQLARPRRQLTGEDASFSHGLTIAGYRFPLLTEYMNIGYRAPERAAECLVCDSVALAVGRRYLGACGRQSQVFSVLLRSQPPLCCAFNLAVRQ